MDKTMDKSVFARTIKELRKKKDLSQKQAAQELNVSQALLSHYENGVREPKQRFLLIIARYYGVTTDALLSGEYGDGGEATVRAVGAVERALVYAGEKRGESTKEAAAEYILAAVANLVSVVERPDRPYEPRLLLEVRRAEADMLEAARKSLKAKN
ncbi:MAG: helix-turn-helix domain-containing protein [Oscillospiraceae bacterium]|jgi:transcriptional regulator with XRE-family HTH domain|nr:helix-turn-helix domain-containing protein [Oscillospiraceae bacterium]